MTDADPANPRHPTPPRRVVVFALGGTIAMSATETGGVAPTLSAAELLQAVPQLAEDGTQVDVVDFRQLASASLDLADLVALARAVDAALADGAHGVVVTQGTDTIEETSFLLDLWHRSDRPVVVTGAMRHPMMAGADGPANLLAAVRVASSSAATGCGALVVLADEVHAARRVRKTHTTSTSTFQSPNAGPLGYVVEGEVRLLSQLPDRFVLPLPHDEQRPRVALVTMTVADHGELLDGLADRVDGVVIAAMGAGHVPERLVPVVTEIASRVPTVLASRTGGGSVLTSTYGFPGSEIDLIARQAIPAGFLDGYKARLLLIAALAVGSDRDTIASAFAAAGGRGDPARWPWAQPGR